MSNAVIPTYTAYGQEIEYEPNWRISTLTWFELAKSARARMTEYAHDIHRWRGERRSFYSALQAMEVDTKDLLD
jgi:hypothetical protein